MTFEEQKNIKALSVTAGIHLLLLLIFIFCGYTMAPMAPPPIAMGMEVNLGTVESAWGADQPEVMGDPVSPDHQMAVQTHPASDETVLHDITTTDRADAPSVATSDRRPERARQEENAAPAHRQTTVQRQPEYEWDGSVGSGGNGAEGSNPGSNEGIGEGRGDMGVNGGTPGADNYRGTPGSGNMSWSMKDRMLVDRPDPKASYQRGGEVVISITVNRAGIITRHRVVSFSNPTLRSIAVAKLQQVKFNRAPDAPPEQRGTITFQFKSVAQ